GPTLWRWVGLLRPHAGRRDQQRLAQLVELAAQHEAELGVRPGDFIDLVKSKRVAAPSEAGVQVMTIHQSKGLEFDAVVLPELDEPIFRGGGETVVVARDDPAGPIARAFPYVKKSLRPVLPAVVSALHEEHNGRTLRDALSGLYVAMTRARHGLYMVVKPRSKNTESLSSARILTEALAFDLEEAEEPGGVTYREGQADWWQRAAAESEVPADTEEAPSFRLRPASDRSRLLEATSPSQLESGLEVDLAEHLHIGSGGGRARGSLIHAWFEQMEWSEDPPDEVTLREVARRQYVPVDQIDDWLVDYRRMLKADAITGALSQANYPDGTEVHRERRFLQREDDKLIEGSFDRLLVIPGDDGQPKQIEIIDFKTDRLDDEPTAVATLVDRYRAQMEAYRRAAARIYDLDPADVTVKLLLLEVGRVEEV
ncbi:MAG: 3'-5' exonuclease, partial [Phycisphaeraceae bacterium]|nr:3'-5' exonuclease [Phycisphaeraceae bacterium]